MRLSEKYQTIIKTTFLEIFPEGDHLWLFGSRVDDTQRGGDIDLYIETNIELEKLDFLPHADWWANLREIRNAYTHSYPDNPEKIAENIERLVESAYELISFWADFKVKIQKYIE